MRFERNFVFAIFLIFLVSYSFADSACAYFFYGNGCVHCAKVEPFLSSLESKYSWLRVEKFEIYGNKSNASLFNDYFDAFGVPSNERGVPVVFFGNDYFVGDSKIMNDFESRLLSDKNTSCPNIESIIASHAGGSSNDIGTLSLMTIIGAAIVDSINPCAIAVLLILFGALVASGGKKRALKAGIAFTISIYISYFLFGLGLFSAIQISGVSYLFYKLVGALAILVGLANIKDYFWYGGGGFVMEIPRSWRPTLKKMLGTVTSPFGAFVMGFAVCLFELPCTGGPYIFILGLLAERATFLSAIPILLLYNMFFVLPLIAITLLLYFGFANVDSASKWKENNLRKLHLVAGLVMLALGIVVLFGFV
ncbi:MAG: cytochrome c biogenesis CcdA family protein [archaeon]